MDKELDTCPLIHRRNIGGWKTFPFIIAAVAGVAIASYGATANLPVYLIQQFNVPNVDAVQISNIASGTSQLAPFLGAVISDAFFGCFAVISVGCASCFLAMLLFTITAAVSSLRPPPCSHGKCKSPTEAQLLVLFTAVTLMVIGLGGTTSTGGEMGVIQLDSSSDQAIFISWYFSTIYLSVVIGLTVIVYIQDNVSWVWGFGLCSVLALLGLTIILLGNPYYRHKKHPKITVIALKISEAEKREVSGTALYDEKHLGGATDSQTSSSTTPKSVADETATDQLDETNLIRLTRLLPLFVCCIIASTCIATQSSTILLQALVMDRHIWLTFSISAATLPVFSYLATALFIPLLEHVIFPSCNHPTALQRIGLGLCITTLAMIYAGLIEWSRLKTLSSASFQLMSVLWLVPCPAILGFAQALLSPAQLEFFYGEFPTSLKATAAGMVPMIIGAGSYVSSVVVELVRRITTWFQDDVNQSRLDIVYWMLAVVGMINLGCFIFSATMYKRRV